MANNNKWDIILIELTPQSIKDYQVCSLYYNYRYNEGIPVPIQQDKILQERFQNTIKRVIAFYFFKKQSLLSVFYSNFLNKWERLWFPKDMDAYELSIVQQNATDNLSHYATIAAGILLRFYEDFQEESGFPLLINEYFSIPITKGTKLSSSFDLVLRYPDKHKIIKWCFDRFKPIPSNYSLELSALKMAWEYRNEDKVPHTEYYLYNLSQAHQGLVRCFPHYKDDKVLIYWARAIESSDIYISKRGLTVYCRGCPFDKPCSEYEYPDPDSYVF